MTRAINNITGQISGGKLALSGWLSTAGLAAAFAAVAGASCCVLPLILASAGVGGAWIAQLAVFVTYQSYIVAGAALLIIAGWVLAIMRHAHRRTFIVLGFATILVAGVFVMPLYESQITQHLLAFIRGSA